MAPLDEGVYLTLKAPIRTAADDKFGDIFPNFQKKGMILHENRLLADDSHDQTAQMCRLVCLICYF